MQTPPDWIQCDRCDKWRVVPKGVAAAMQTAQAEWYCEMHPKYAEMHRSSADVASSSSEMHPSSSEMHPSSSEMLVPPSACDEPEDEAYAGVAWKLSGVAAEAAAAKAREAAAAEDLELAYAESGKPLHVIEVSCQHGTASLSFTASTPPPPSHLQLMSTPPGPEPGRHAIHRVHRA